MHPRAPPVSRVCPGQATGMTGHEYTDRASPTCQPLSPLLGILLLLSVSTLRQRGLWFLAYREPLTPGDLHGVPSKDLISHPCLSVSLNSPACSVLLATVSSGLEVGFDVKVPITHMEIQVDE